MARIEKKGFKFTHNLFSENRKNNEPSNSGKAERSIGACKKFNERN